MQRIFNEKMINDLCDLFFNRNFGQTSKSEMELFMFHCYMENMRCGQIVFTDYQISKELGVTQQQVRNLRIKEQLKYPREIVWQDELEKLIPNARYDDPYIVIDMPDPNVLIEIKNYLENRGRYVIVQRNVRLLTMRIESFVDLAIEINPEKNTNEVYKELLKQLQKDNKIDEGKLHPNINACKEIVDLGIDITTIVANLATVLSPDNIFIKTLIALVK